MYALKVKVNLASRRIEHYRNNQLVRTCSKVVPENSPMWIDTSYHSNGKIRNIAWLGWTLIHIDNDNNRMWSNDAMVEQTTSNGAAAAV